VDPFDLSARAHLVRLLNAANRRDEAEAQRDVAVRMAREIGPEAVREFNDAARLGEDVGASEAGRPAGAAPARAIHQEVRYCVTSDSIRLAYASVGEGPPLVKTANWLSHLEFDWESPVWRHMLRELCREHRLVRYDERGLGLSDWSTDVLSLDRFVEDLETVVEASVEGRFALLGVSQGATAAVAYAVRHPDRLTHLILYGGYASGWRVRNDPAEIERREAMLTLMRQGWGQANPAFRQMFTSLFIPGGSDAEMRWLNDLQRVSTSPDHAIRRSIATSTIDVSSLLPKVAVPTLVMHCRDDAVVPFHAGMELAKSIPGARFRALEGKNHLLLENEPAWPQFAAEVRRFLST
jgi:pimeloyl-ACP methyl ester carboxylesterase